MIDKPDIAGDTEQRILTAAEQEFFRKGYAASRTTAIAEAAGVTPAMLHYYFRSKEKLFERVISEKLSALAHTFALNFDPEKDLEDCLRQAVESHFDFVCANPDLPRFMVNEVFTNPALIEMLRKKLETVAYEVIMTLQTKIDIGVLKGRCRAVGAKSLLIDIVSLNVFPVLAAPFIEAIHMPSLQAEPEMYLSMRRRDNVDAILRIIGIK